MWHLNNSSQKLNLKYESPASHPWVTRLLRSGAIESPASRWKMRVPREAKLSRDDRPLLYHGLAISNTCSHAKNRNDPIPITWSKVALHEDAFFAVAILGGGWLQSPASDGPPCGNTGPANNSKLSWLSLSFWIFIAQKSGYRDHAYYIWAEISYWLHLTKCAIAQAAMNREMLFLTYQGFFW